MPAMINVLRRSIAESTAEAVKDIELERKTARIFPAKSIMLTARLMFIAVSNIILGKAI